VQLIAEILLSLQLQLGSRKPRIAIRKAVSLRLDRPGLGRVQKLNAASVT
jgi:hypothetical protein